MLALGSAFEHGVNPLVLGLGQKIGWAYNMGSVYGVYREYVYNKTDENDIILIFDAYDVMFLTGKEELLNIYLSFEARTGREIIYNADEFCSSPRKAEYPKCHTPWKYLNSGIYMGRARAMRRLFGAPTSSVVLDKNGKPKHLQNIHTDFFLDHQDLVAIDSNCELTQVVFDLPEVFTRSLQDGSYMYDGPKYFRLFGKRIVNTLTNTTPPLIHFPGVAHWPDWSDPKRVGTCLAYEFFRLAHSSFVGMMEESSVVRQGGKYFGQAPWKQICTFYVSPFDYIGFRIQHVGDYVIWFRYNHSMVFFSLCFVLLLVIYAISSYASRKLRERLANQRRVASSERDFEA